MRYRQLCYPLVILATALAITGFVPAASISAQEVKWRHDYHLARREAQEKNLPLVIDFGTENCYWCIQLDKITFRDPQVIAVMNERYLPLKIDANREPQLTQALRIESYPTLVLAAPDGKIINSVVGFQDAARFHEILLRGLATITPPDWMTRDYKLAVKSRETGQFPKAIILLKSIVEDGKSRPVQVEARNLLNLLDKQAAERIHTARQLQEQGKTAQAMDSLNETIRLFPGLASTREASDLVTRLAQNNDNRQQQRAKRARELMVQAREFHKNKEFLLCLDRADLVLSSFGDLAEGLEAQQLIAQIKSEPEWMQAAVDSLSDRLGTMYLLLAESLARKGSPQLAAQYLERVIRSFPGTRQAESAQIRLQQLRGVPATQPVEYRGEDLERLMTPPPIP